MEAEATLAWVTSKTTAAKKRKEAIVEQVRRFANCRREKRARSEETESLEEKIGRGAECFKMSNPEDDKSAKASGSFCKRKRLAR